MPTVVTIDPVTRIEGHLKIDVQIDRVGGTLKVIDAWTTGTMFRGIERILVDRDPTEAPGLTQRICGVCPVPQAMAAVLALESAAGLTAPSNAQVLRNLLMGANFLQSHILHFYHLCLPDFVAGPSAPPLTPAWNGDYRLGATDAKRLQQHYAHAIGMTRQAHEMGALLGGRMPHPASFVPGGFSAPPKPANLARFQSILAGLLAFIQGEYADDVALIAKKYGDYAKLGKGYAALLSYGAFAAGTDANTRLFKPGIVQTAAKEVTSLDISHITENVSHSWYADSVDVSPAQGDTNPQHPKGNAYSWIKAPRYDGKPYETGPLARMRVNGDYKGGVSVIDRHAARVAEAAKIAKAMQTWLAQWKDGDPVYTSFTTPQSASCVGITEAPRGALGHWVQIANRKISRYQLITPTCWNASPRDEANMRGPIEQALIGTPVKNQAEPIEVLRVIHSFDPCLACAVHVMRPAQSRRIYTLGA